MPGFNILSTDNVAGNVKHIQRDKNIVDELTGARGQFGAVAAFAGNDRSI